MLFIVAIGLALGGRKMCESPSHKGEGEKLLMASDPQPRRG
jgi:hypothetical protein